MAEFAGGVLLYLGTCGNTIGGLTATPGTGAGNLISGNTYTGVWGWIVRGRTTWWQAT